MYYIKLSCMIQRVQEIMRNLWPTYTTGRSQCLGRLSVLSNQWAGYRTKGHLHEVSCLVDKLCVNCGMWEPSEGSCNKTNPRFELYAFFRSFCIPYHLFLCCHMTVRLMSGSLNSHHAPAHMTKSSLMWLSASSCDSQSHSLITFYLTCNILLSSPLLLSITFNLYSHSTTLSQLLLSLSPLPFATLPILRFTSLQTILTLQPIPLSDYLCHHSLYIGHSH